MKLSIFIFFIGMLFLASCNDDITPIDPDYTGIEYFPLDSTTYISYDVVSITIDKPVDRYDTIKYSLIEKITGSYTDNSGNTAYILERWIKEPDDEAYNLSDVWVKQVFDLSAQTVEENIRYVKIRFPVKKEKSWNGNLFNTGNDMNYTIFSMDTPMLINGFSFDSTLSVVQEADSSLIHKNLSKEVYAAGVGLVYKQNVNINSQDVVPDIPVDDRITTGTLYFQTITGYGNY